MEFNEGFSISKNYCSSDWINLKFEDEKDWKKGVRIFMDRIESRYFKHMDCMACNEYSGFAIMSLSSLLIETLMQFREGKEDTIGNTGKVFEKFITTNFKDCCEPKNSDMNKIAKIFFDKIRCGLLHQAETKGGTKINIRDDENTEIIFEFIDDFEEDIRIYRDNFYKRLKKIVNNYAEDICTAKNDTEIRKNFRKKMDYICRNIKIEYYFAYGSNLLKEQMIERTGNALKKSNFTLKRYKIFFNKKSYDGTGKANIVYTGNKEDEVEGVLYKVTQDEINKLDHTEGGYERRIIDTGKDYTKAYAYMSINTCKSLKPSDEYLKKILKGAAQNRLSNDYINKLKSLGRN